MQVGAIGITLPDFHQRVAERITFRIEDSPAHVSYFANPGRGPLVDHQQVIIGVERQVIWIKRPFRLARSLRQFLREKTGRREKRGGPGCIADEMTAIHDDVHRFVWVFG